MAEDSDLKVTAQLMDATFAALGQVRQEHSPMEKSHRMLLLACEQVLRDVDECGRIDVTTITRVEEAVRAARGQKLEATNA